MPTKARREHAGTTRGRRRWAILGIGWSAQAVMCCYTYGIPMLVPALRSTSHASLPEAGVVVASPGFGALCTMLAWGYAADRWGERLVIVAGLAMAAGFLAGACFASGIVALCVLLALAGAAGGAVNAASGRAVLGWFAVEERGFAMGVRQTAQPLGVGIAALTLPSLARTDVRAALVLPSAMCALVALVAWLWLVNPPRRGSPASESGGSPYRTPTLWRVHAASSALVVPQFAISAFVLDYLVTQRHWPVLAAGRLVFAMQVAGAFGRVGAGIWSDRVGSRLRPMRQLAVASAITMVAIAVADSNDSRFVVLALAAGALVTVSDNGLGYTAAAEIAGPAWAGRALGAQNTAQNVAAVATPPLLAQAVEGWSYAWAFALAAVFPLLALVFTPVDTPRSAQAGGRRRAIRGVPWG